MHARSRSRAPGLLVAALAAAAAACASGCPTPGPAGPTLKASDVPRTTPGVIALADDLYGRGDRASLENALFALEEGRSRAGGDVELAWRAARAAAALAGDPDVARARRLELAARGVEHARAALAAAPDTAPAHYYLAINLGLRAQALAATGATGGLETVPAIADAARSVIRLSPGYDHAGAFRLLGMLLVRAPPWPASIGDVAEGVRNLEEAVRRDGDFPLNHLLLAEGLIEAGEYARAHSEIDLVLAAPPEGEWGRIGARWRAHAKELLDEIARLTGGGEGGDGEIPR